VIFWQTKRENNFQLCAIIIPSLIQLERYFAEGEVKIERMEYV
jgi:hypothetical protein